MGVVVGETVGVAVGVAIGETVGVAVGVAVGVGVGGFGVSVGNAVGVAVGVGVGGGSSARTSPFETWSMLPRKVTAPPVVMRKKPGSSKAELPRSPAKKPPSKKVSEVSSS